jgi:hypothetical protein
LEFEHYLLFGICLLVLFSIIPPFHHSTIPLHFQSPSFPLLQGGGSLQRMRSLAGVCFGLVIRSLEFEYYLPFGICLLMLFSIIPPFHHSTIPLHFQSPSFPFSKGEDRYKE